MKRKPAGAKRRKKDLTPSPAGAAAMPALLASSSPLEALGLQRVDYWHVDKLESLSVAELLAVTYDLGEADPARSMMLHVHNDLLTLELALRSEATTPTSEALSRFLHRVGVTALVAAELHRRALHRPTIPT